MKINGIEAQREVPKCPDRLGVWPSSLGIRHKVGEAARNGPITANGESTEYLSISKDSDSLTLINIYVEVNNMT